MTTIAQSVAGTTLRISASLPATYDSAGFTALSYTLVSEITDMGDLGKEYTLITHNPVNDRKTYKFKGSYNNGSLALKLARATLVTTDAGQTIVIAAAASDADYSFKITFQDGGDLFFTGKILSFKTMIGSVNNILQADCKVEITSDILETT